MSIASWAIIAVKGLSLVAAQRPQPARSSTSSGTRRSLDAVAGEIATHGARDPFSHLTEHAMHAQAHHARYGAAKLEEAGTASEFVTRTIKKVLDEETTRLENGLTLLATVGATAPFVGLFGTVWGVYHALVAIGMSGAGTLDKVAGPVGEALIMTGLGLAVAIPAVVGYNWLTRANRVLAAKLDAFAYELHTFVSMGQPLGSGAGAERARAANVRPLAAPRRRRPDGRHAMAFASFDPRQAGAPMAEINMVPLIDVMLVLLVIFIITAPLLTQAVKLELPKATSQVNDLQAGEDRLRDRRRRPAVLERRGGVARRRRSSASRPKAGKPVQPEVHLRADQGVAYRFVAQTLADASKAGLTQIGFVSEAGGREPRPLMRRAVAGPRRAAAAPSRRRRSRAADAATRAPIASETLFGGASEVQIAHRGVALPPEADRARQADPDQITFAPIPPSHQPAAASPCLLPERKRTVSTPPPRRRSHPVALLLCSARSPPASACSSPGAGADRAAGTGIGRLGAAAPAATPQQRTARRCSRSPSRPRPRPTRTRCVRRPRRSAAATRTCATSRSR